MAVKKQVELETGKLKCLMCERLHTDSVNKYYKHKNKFVKSERYPLCKDCIDTYIGNKESEGYKERVIEILCELNLPFDHKTWETSGSEWRAGKTSYIQKINSLEQYKNLTFKDSNFGLDQQFNLKCLDTDDSIDDEIRMFWPEYEDVQIKELEMYYNNLTEGYECESLIQELLLKQIAITQYKLNRTANTKEYTDLVNTISKLMTDANVKPTQKNNTNQSEAIYGVWIKKIEDEEPIPEPLKEFKDVDKINKYIYKYFTSHFSKLFGLSSNSESDSK